MEKICTRKFVYSILQIMRLSTFVILILIQSVTLLMANDVPGQGILQKKVTFLLKDEPLSDALDKLSTQADVRFFYAASVLDGKAKVNLDVKQERLGEVLKKLLEPQRLSFTVSDNKIVISKSSRINKTANDTNAAHPPAIIEVSGAVVSAVSGEGLPGVNIGVKGTSVFTTSDDKGNYHLTASEKAVLIFSYIGYQTKEVEVNGKKHIDVRLVVDGASLGEVVVVGYGVQKKRNLTGSITSVKAEQFETQSVNYLTEMLRGNVAGLSATLGTSAKGAAAFDIRGTSSISANNTPLIVIDGIIYIGDLADINPNDIQKIDVLKDASAAAVFGSRAAAGVIMITTKKGVSRKPVISYNGKLNFAQAGPAIKPRGPGAYIRQRTDAMIRDNPARANGFYNDPGKLPEGVSLEDWRNMGNQSGTDTEIWLNRIGLAENEIDNYMQNKSIDWFDEVYRTGLRNDHNINVSGKSDNLNYYVSLGYLDNEGMISGDDLKNLRARINLDANITSYLKIGVNSQFSSRDENAAPADGGSLMRYASPLGDKYDTTGKLKWYPNDDIVGINPFLYTKEGGSQYLSNSDNLTANLYAELALPLGFKYRVNWINSLAYSQNYQFIPSSLPDGEPAGTGSRREGKVRYWMVDNILSWNRTFGAHNFDLTLLYNAEKQMNWASTMSNANFFPNESLGYGALHIGTTPGLDVNDSKKTGDAIMGRLNYTLLDKYLFTFSMRRDGYSAFGKSNPYAYFPAAAFAWRLSKEKFFNWKLVDDLKFRFSYGVNGNREIGIYSALSELSTVYYNYGSTSATGAQTITMANNNLRWERTSAYNAGMDFSILSSKITGTVDAYYMSTRDLLLQRSLPDIIGFKTVMANLGEITNKGLEVTLSSQNIQKPNFSWRSTAVFSMNRNMIKHLYGDMVDVKDASGKVIGKREDDDVQNGWYIGKALDRIYDYKVTGVWQVNDKEEAAKYGNEPGDFRVLDVNGDGKILSQDDMIFQGYTKPRYQLSLLNEVALYKNFKVSFMLSANLDYWGTNNIHKNNSTFFARVNNWDVPYWTPENPTNEWGRLRSVGGSYNYRVSRSFLKLQTFSFSYDLPATLIDPLKVQKFQMYFNVQNIILGTPWDNGDPETGGIAPRIMTFGINLTL